MTSDIIKITYSSKPTSLAHLGCQHGGAMCESIKWQAIATAPKDGRDILVGYDFASVWVVHVAFWRDCDAFNDPLPAGHEGIGWWSYIADSVTQTKLNNDNAPTHWMPLPKLPNE